MAAGRMEASLRRGFWWVHNIVVRCTYKMDVDLLDQRLECKQDDGHFRGGDQLLFSSLLIGRCI